MSRTREPYTTDVSDDVWAVVVPYLTLLSVDVSNRRSDLREAYNGVRYIRKTGAHWRTMPHDLPPWPVDHQQARRWIAAGCFEHIVHDVRILLRRLHVRPNPPTAVILDSWQIE